MANVVFSADGSRRLSWPELRRAFVRGGGQRVRDYYPVYPKERLDGVHCRCNGEGEFLLRPYEPGEKNYMDCRKCGGVSHL